MIWNTEIYGPSCMAGRAWHVTEMNITDTEGAAGGMKLNMKTALIPLIMLILIWCLNCIYRQLDGCFASSGAMDMECRQIPSTPQIHHCKLTFRKADDKGIQARFIHVAVHFNWEVQRTRDASGIVSHKGTISGQIPVLTSKCLD